MPIVAVYNPRCDTCETNSLIYGSTVQAAQTKAQRAGWSIYPLLCKSCARHLREKVRRESQNRRSVRESREGS